MGSSQFAQPASSGQIRTSPTRIAKSLPARLRRPQVRCTAEAAMSEITKAGSLGRLRPRSQRRARNQEAKTASRKSDIAMDCVIYKTDQFLVDFGYEG